MTKLIGILILVVAIFGGYKLFTYYTAIDNSDNSPSQQASKASAVVPEQLPGLPQQLDASYTAAKGQLPALRNWLKAYGVHIQDPRKAWIELDYCVMLGRENPAEARRVFAAVKERTSPSSPVWPRIKELEKTFE